MTIVSLIKTTLCFVACAALWACAPSGGELDIFDLEVRLAQAQPGDTLVLKNGTYTDVSLKINAKGTAEQPIVIKAAKNGEVILTGESTLKIGGEHLAIEGLYFKDGKLGKTPIITFKDGGHVANYCRLSSCVIENYNPENRFEKTDYVQLYGRNNRIDHCSFSGKYSAGLMLVVKLNSEESRNTNHRIEYNHFSHRPRLGSNGGETVRIGTSTYSLDPARVNFSNNYFEYCSGEVEILSVKATDNVISGNVFYECEGVLALRHGNRNVVTDNVFIGNGKPNTGGIRVINAGHRIMNNHFQDLTGDRFWSALAVMNGVPNSAINRYHRVKDVKMSGNTFINCDNIGFGIGTDGERTALPQDVDFSDNVIYSNEPQKLHFLDDMSAIAFSKNKINDAVEVNRSGFEKTTLKVEQKGALWHVKNGGSSAKSVSKKAFGAAWFAPTEQDASLCVTHKVADASTLETTIEKAECGDIILLTKEDTYAVKRALLVNKKLTLKKANNLASNPLLRFEKNTGEPLIIIAEGGDLTLDGVDFNGISEGGVAPCAIRTQEQPFLTQYKLRVHNCHFYNFDAGGRTVFSATPTSYADTVLFRNCRFSNISGIAINLKAEKDDIGRYNAEHVILENCLFHDVMGAAIDLYRGGNDESTSGPKLSIDQCTFYNVENRELGSVIHLTGVQEVNISNCVFAESGKSGRVIKMESPRWAKCSIDYCNFHHCGRIETFYNKRLGENIWQLSPTFENPKEGNYNLKNTSPLQQKSTSGKALGSSL